MGEDYEKIETKVEKRLKDLDDFFKGLESDMAKAACALVILTQLSRLVEVRKNLSKETNDLDERIDKFSDIVLNSETCKDVKRVEGCAEFTKAGTFHSKGL